jgi:hypothetical protein
MNLNKLIIAAALIAATSAAAFGAAVPEIDPNKLSEAEVATTDLSKPGAAGKTYFAATVINATVPRLCAILSDFSDYPSFMPNTDKAVVLQSGGEYAVVDITLKLALGKIKKYRLKMESKSSAQSCYLGWQMIPRPELTPAETIADTSGYWELSPLPSNRNKTVVKYYVYSDPGPVPLGLGWIVDALGKEGMPKALEALRGKARVN